MSISLSISTKRQHLSPLLSLRPPAGRAPYSAAIADHKPISGIPSGPRQGKLDVAEADRAGRADVARTVRGQQPRAVDEGPARRCRDPPGRAGRRRSAAGHAAGRPTDRAPQLGGPPRPSPVSDIGCRPSSKASATPPPATASFQPRRSARPAAAAASARAARAGRSTGRRRADSRATAAGHAVARPAHEGEHPQQDQRHHRADAGQRQQDRAQPAQPGRPALSTMRQHIQAASTRRPGRRRWSGRTSPAGPRSRSPSLSASPATALAVRPVAEGQHRHDDERADHRHEMEQRQQRPRSRRARRCARSARSAAARTAHARPGSPSGAKCRARPASQITGQHRRQVHRSRPAPRLRSRPARRAAGARPRRSSAPAASAPKYSGRP